jgi:hypothetical protein
MVPDSSFYVAEKSMTSGRSCFGEPQLEKIQELLESSGEAA